MKDSYFIPYKTTGGCIVDWDFQSIIHCLPWHKHSEGYAVTTTPKFNYMHRLLLNFPEEVDHN